MKYNINVINFVWRQLRKANRATLDAIRSRAVHRGLSSQTDILCEKWKHLLNPTIFPEGPAIAGLLEITTRQVLARHRNGFRGKRIAR